MGNVLSILLPVDVLRHMHRAAGLRFRGLVDPPLTPALPQTSGWGGCIVNVHWVCLNHRPSLNLPADWEKPGREEEAGKGE